MAPWTVAGGDSARFIKKRVLKENGMSVSVLILTLNEEINLPDCLESVAWSDDIVVFDSFSTDRTVEIARAAGARVVQRKFDNYAAQRNAALTDVDYRHPWVLMVDADERWPGALGREIGLALEADSAKAVSLYHFRRKDLFLGRWLRRSSGYPTWFGRLVRRGQVRVEREINEEYHTDGGKAYLPGLFLHLPFNKGFACWLERHNRYSTMEAAALMEEAPERTGWAGLFSRDPVARRKAQKRLAYRLPGRPLLMFLALYVVRLGFLDGRAGLIYCTLRAIYEYMIDLKVNELKRREKGQHI
ncbi:MAG: glycosyltransferase family 2 protein [Candidatus Sumerlaeota bacterium]|nr:glycosyltransferase family 2 protein [Candidatus Sumerlaeota bacterium]